MIRYTLSNRQRTALFTRDTAIRIAIPIHPNHMDAVHDESDEQLRRRACQAIANTQLEHVRHVEIKELAVTQSSGDGLNGVIGSIVQRPRNDLWCFTVPAIVATLSTMPRPRNHQPNIQWPIDVNVNGHIIPKKSGERPAGSDADED